MPGAFFMPSRGKPIKDHMLSRKRGSKTCIFENLIVNLHSKPSGMDAMTSSSGGTKAVAKVTALVFQAARSGPAVRSRMIP